MAEQTSKNNHEEKLLTLALDIGGTTTGISLLNQNTSILEFETMDTRSQEGMDGVLDRICNKIRELFSEQLLENVGCVGAAVAGLVDRKKGIVQSAPNLGWVRVPLKQELEDRLQLPVFACNDVDAAAWGEWKQEETTEVQNLIAVFIGTGVGTGVVIGGNLLEGKESSAAELGHIPVVPDGRDCTCPHRGCLEAYAGGWALAKQAQEKVQENPAGGQRLVEMAGSEDDINARHVAEAAKEGNKMAKSIIKNAGRLLGIWAVGLVNAFNPDRFVLGGSVINGIPELIPRMKHRIQRCAFSAFAENLSLQKSSLEEEASVIGAASLARTRWEKSL